MSTEDPTPSTSNGAMSEGTTPEIPQEDIDRVREIILGPDTARQRLRRAEADRLREIIFGAQMEEYERRFTDLRRESERMGSDLRQMQERFGELEKSIAHRVETAELEVRRLSDELRRELERGRNRDALLQQLATQVRQHEDTIVGAIEGVLDLRKSHALHDADIRSQKVNLIETRDHVEQRSQTVRREIRTTEDTLRAELRRFADRLDNQKTDRKALASMLIEIATRLETGNTVTGLLEGLSGSKD